MSHAMAPLGRSGPATSPSAAAAPHSQIRAHAGRTALAVSAWKHQVGSSVPGEGGFSLAGRKWQSTKEVEMCARL